MNNTENSLSLNAKVVFVFLGKFSSCRTITLIRHQVRDYISGVEYTMPGNGGKNDLK